MTIAAICNQCGAKGAGHTFDWDITNIPELKGVSVELLYNDDVHNYHVCLSCLLIMLNAVIIKDEPSDILFTE